MIELDQCLLAPPHGGARIENALALPYGRARSMHSSFPMSPHGRVDTF